MNASAHDLIQRLQLAVSQMDSHQKSREQGKLLIDCLGFLQHLAAEEKLAPFLEANPDVMRSIADVCQRAGVGSVTASDQYGMMFLLSEGPDQVGGIVYRNDALEYQALKALAGKVNEVLSQEQIPGE